MIDEINIHGVYKAELCALHLLAGLKFIVVMQDQCTSSFSGGSQM